MSWVNREVRNIGQWATSLVGWVGRGEGKRERERGGERDVFHRTASHILCRLIVDEGMLVDPVAERSTRRGQQRWGRTTSLERCGRVASVRDIN